MDDDHTERRHALTDEDVDRIAAKFEERFAKRFYIGLGKGILGFAWKGIVMLIIILAAYGMGKGWKL